MIYNITDWVYSRCYLTMSTLAQSLKQGTMVSFEEVIFGHYPQSYYLSSINQVFHTCEG